MPSFPTELCQLVFSYLLLGRRASLLCSPSYQCEQLLGVAPLVQETVALEVYGQLLNLERDKQVAAAIFLCMAIIGSPRRGLLFTLSACLTDLS